MTADVVFWTYSVGAIMVGLAVVAVLVGRARAAWRTRRFTVDE